jgi:hypothetical protein
MTRDQGSESRPSIFVPKDSIPGQRTEPTLKHSRLAIASCSFGVFAALAWLSLPILDKTMSLGEPFGSMLFVLPAFVMAAMATFLGIALGIASFLVGRSLHPKKRRVLAGIGILLSLSPPLILWIILIVW